MGRPLIVSAFWNVNLDSTISIAHDGEMLAAFDFVIDRERRRNARPRLAHAIAAGLALQEQDPSVALASAMYNACQADRARWPALRADVRARLS